METRKLSYESPTLESFITISTEAFCILETLLTIPSTRKKGKTMFIVSAASEGAVSDTSQSLIVKVLTARHKMSPAFRTVSLMSSIARNVVAHILCKCLETWTTTESSKYRRNGTAYQLVEADFNKMTNHQ